MNTAATGKVSTEHPQMRAVVLEEFGVEPTLRSVERPPRGPGSARPCRGQRREPA